MRVTFEKCTQLLNDAKNIALFCHIRPDGDTLGAALGLKFAFKKVEKNVDIYCESDIPEKFKKFGFAGNFNTQLLKTRRVRFVGCNRLRRFRQSRRIRLSV